MQGEVEVRPRLGSGCALVEGVSLGLPEVEFDLE